MALTFTESDTLWDGRSKVFTWTLVNGEAGQPVELPSYADRSIQVIGTFGAGGNARVEGSNNGTNYAVLTDPQGNALDITAAKIEAITENVRWMRPRITAGDGTTILTVLLLARRPA